MASPIQNSDAATCYSLKNLSFCKGLISYQTFYSDGGATGDSAAATAYVTYQPFFPTSTSGSSSCQVAFKKYLCTLYVPACSNANFDQMPCAHMCSSLATACGINSSDYPGFCASTNTDCSNESSIMTVGMAAIFAVVAAVTALLF